ncbi:MAG: J domain-containing protein [Desulfuromonadaceae bacterium]|nr:J domain-containing protein [Desulfuromonadaceae bacterium]
MTFEELQQSLKTLGLYDRSTMKQIKGRHRELVKRYHPDAGGDENNEQIQLINAAYTVLTDYLAAYCYSFSEEEFYSQNPEERIRRQFMDSPLWGGNREQRRKE